MSSHACKYYQPCSKDLIVLSGVINMHVEKDKTYKIELHELIAFFKMVI